MNILDTLSFGKIVQLREVLLKAQAAGKKVYRFESGDPSFSIAPHALAGLQAAAAAGKTHYIPNAGIPELRRAIRDKLERKNAIRVPSEENIFVTNGAMHALFAAFQCVLSEGDEVIVPDPMWTEVVENIKLARGVPVAVALRAANDYQYAPSDIEAALTPRTRVIFLNTPHNPTGAVLSRETLGEILQVARRRNLLVVSDEAYEDVIYEPHMHHSIGSLAPDYQDNVISVFSFSKSHAMSGLRVGYLVSTAPQVMDRLQKVLRCSINGVNSVAQWTALAALQGDESHLAGMRAEYAKRRDIMFEALSGIQGLRPFYPHGAFYIWAELDRSLYARLGCANADEVSSKLASMGIGSAPGEAFGSLCHDAIRFAFSCSTEMIQEGAPVLRSALLASLPLRGRT
ncbi:MAG: aminotransferase class I/II-fold pyridoxal phosphate-dependent enzyme [Deltaproteobacteria bacterium]|nr:aminotransferase class I/II-fold pyridoxal phosphate-dependent enzyme [Deltaproteobacteria bacterium]